jgi:hypothetical protein
MIYDARVTDDVRRARRKEWKTFHAAITIRASLAGALLLTDRESGP